MYEGDSKTTAYIFAAMAAAMVAIYWHYTQRSLKLQAQTEESIIEYVKGFRVDSGASSNGSHSPKHEGVVEAWETLDGPEDYS